MAERLDKGVSVVYAWMADESASQSRNIGPTSVREIEAALGLKRGWMDTQHEDQDVTQVREQASQSGRMDPVRLRDAMAILADLAAEQIGPDSGGFAHDYRYIAIAYNYLLARNEPAGASNVTDIRRGIAAAIRSEISSAPPESAAA